MFQQASLEYFLTLRQASIEQTCDLLSLRQARIEVQRPLFK